LTFTHGGERPDRYGEHWVSFWGIDLPKTKSLENSAGHTSFSVQNHIEAAAFDAMTPRKGALISFPLNRGPQQVNNFVVIKYEQVTAQAGLAGKLRRTFALNGCRSLNHDDTLSLRQAPHLF
jgi:hypothetical protein